MDRAILELLYSAYSATLCVLRVDAPTGKLSSSTRGSGLRRRCSSTGVSIADRVRLYGPDRLFGRSLKGRGGWTVRPLLHDRPWEPSRHCLTVDGESRSARGVGGGIRL